MTDGNTIGAPDESAEVERLRRAVAHALEWFRDDEQVGMADVMAEALDPTPPASRARGIGEEPRGSERDGFLPERRDGTHNRRWPHHGEEHADLGDGPAFPLDELTEWIVRETFVRCSSCKGTGHGGECECGGSGFDWGYTDEVRALLTKLMTEADRG